MNLKLKERLPKWYEHINSNDNFLVISNDVDSLLSAMFINQKFGIPVGGFLDFDKGVYFIKNVANGKEPIYLDASIIQPDIKVFDNHYTQFKNNQSINPNNFVILKSYNQKYCASTYSLILSLYEHDIRKFSDYQLSLLLCVDAFYKSYYNQNGAFRPIIKRWIDLLGFTDVLIPFLECHNMQYFKDFIDKYKLYHNIYINNGYLYSKLNFPLPTDKFELVKPLQKQYVDKVGLSVMDESTFFICAETFGNKFVLNY